MHIRLGNADSFGFRTAALELLAHQVNPSTVSWSSCAADDLTSRAPETWRASRAVAAVVPRSFLRTIELVVLHRDPERFEILYRTLWRLVHEPALKDDAIDGDLMQLRAMVQSVRRDLHRMRSTIAFVPMQRGHGAALPCAWAAPAHFITEAYAIWRVEKARMPGFAVATPERMVVHEYEEFRYLPGVPAPPGDEAHWRALLRRP